MWIVGVIAGVAALFVSVATFVHNRRGIYYGYYNRDAIAFRTAVFLIPFGIFAAGMNFVFVIWGGYVVVLACAGFSVLGVTLWWLFEREFELAKLQSHPAYPFRSGSSGDASS